METLYFTNNTLVKFGTTIRVYKLYYHITRIIIVDTLVKIVFLLLSLLTSYFFNIYNENRLPFII